MNVCSEAVGRELDPKVGGGGSGGETVGQWKGKSEVKCIYWEGGSQTEASGAQSGGRESWRIKIRRGERLCMNKASGRGE